MGIIKAPLLFRGKKKTNICTGCLIAVQTFRPLEKIWLNT